jgi:multidrug efflux pump
VAHTRAISTWLDGAGVDPRVEMIFRGEDEEQRKVEELNGKAFAVARVLTLVLAALPAGSR